MLVWFILWTLVYYLQLSVSKLILSREGVNHDDKALEIQSLILSIINISLVFRLHNNKNDLVIDKLWLNYIIIFMLSVSSSLDLKIMRVPSYFLRFVLLLMVSLNIRGDLLAMLLDGLLIYMILYLVYIVSKKSIGGADVRILTLLALGIGRKNSIMILVYSSWICLVFYIIKSLVRLKTDTKEIAFIPYIYLGYVYLIYSYKL